MITKFVDRFIDKEHILKKKFIDNEPREYIDIVKVVVDLLHAENEKSPDSKKVHEIDDGDYQGVLLYVIGTKGYTSTNYWYTKVDYGSCSSCDILQGILSEKNKETRIKDYMTLSLHIVQEMKILN